jgi:hypothetical protein
MSISAGTTARGRDRAARAHAGACSDVSHQVDHLEVGLGAGVAVDFGADLQGLARGEQPGGRACSTGPQ